MTTKTNKVDSDIIFNNPSKHARAIGILALVNSNQATPAIKSEYSTVESREELKQKFVSILAENDIDPKGKDALMFVYKKLGGSVMTYEKKQRIIKSLKKSADSKKALESSDDEKVEDDEAEEDDDE